MSTVMFKYILRLNDDVFHHLTPHFLWKSYIRCVLLFYSSLPEQEYAFLALEEPRPRLRDLCRYKPLDRNAGMIIVEPQLGISSVFAFEKRSSCRALTHDLPSPLKHVASGAPYFVGFSMASSNGTDVSTTLMIASSCEAWNSAIRLARFSLKKSRVERICSSDQSSF